MDTRAWRALIAAGGQSPQTASIRAPLSTGRPPASEADHQSAQPRAVEIDRPARVVGDGQWSQDCHPHGYQSLIFRLRICLPSLAG
jgi:hypothetical protein